MSFTVCCVAVPDHACCAGLQKGAFFTQGFLIQLFLSWINSRYVLAATRREILVAWMASLVERMSSDGAAALLEEPDDLGAALAWLVPREKSMQSIILAVWTRVLQPAMRSNDAALAQLDG